MFTARFHGAPVGEDTDTFRKSIMLLLHAHSVADGLHLTSSAVDWASGCAAESPSDAIAFLQQNSVLYVL